MTINKYGRAGAFFTSLSLGAAFLAGCGGRGTPEVATPPVTTPTVVLPTLPTHPVLADNNLYTTFQSTDGHNINWILCSKPPLGPSGCGSSGTLGPYNQIGAIMEGAATGVGNTVTRNVYVLDTKAGTSQNGVTLNIASSQITASGNNFSATITPEKTITLPLVGGAGVVAYMSRNDSGLYIATNNSATPYLVNETTFAVTALPALPGPINGIEGDEFGFITIRSGIGASTNSVLYNDAGTLVKSVAGAIAVADTHNATIYNNSPGVTWVACAQTANVTGGCVTGALTTLGTTGAILFGEPTEPAGGDTVTRLIYEANYTSYTSGMNGNAVILNIYQQTDTVQNNTDTNQVTLLAAIVVPGIVGGANALPFMSSTNDTIYIASNLGSGIAMFNKSTLVMTAPGASINAPNITGMRADDNGNLTITQGDIVYVIGNNDQGLLDGGASVPSIFLTSINAETFNSANAYPAVVTGRGLADLLPITSGGANGGPGVR